MIPNPQKKYGSVVLIKPDANNRQYYQPDSAIEESLRDPSWYVDNIKYACTFYDTWYTPMMTPLVTSGVAGSGNAGSGSDWGNNDETPVQNMMRMMSYYN